MAFKLWQKFIERNTLTPLNTQTYTWNKLHETFLSLLHVLYANTFQVFLKIKIVIYQWAQPIIAIAMASIFNKFVFMEI